MLKILPYNIGSKSAKALAHALGVKRIIPDGGYRPRSHIWVLNWGNSHPNFTSGRFINQPNAVAIAANKLATLTRLREAGVSVPEFTTDTHVASEWLEDGFKVMVRHKLNSHSGQGIQVIRPEDECCLPHAPLYTKYTKKDQEYRIHVFQGRVIDLCEKRRRTNGGTEAHPLIRNHSHGWVFCRDNVFCPDFVKQTAIKAVQSIGLDFGGVDIIQKMDRCWVLEVNTAPGLEGTTLTKYVEALRGYAQQTQRRNEAYRGRELRGNAYRW